MTLEGLSSACAKLQPASLKNKEILEMNVLQKFTSHALYFSPYQHVLNQEQIKFLFQPKITAKSRTETVEFGETL